MMEVKEELKPTEERIPGIKVENLEVIWETEDIYEDNARLLSLSPALKTEEKIPVENLEVKWEIQDIYEDNAKLLSLSPGLKTEEKIPLVRDHIDEIASVNERETANTNDVASPKRRHTDCWKEASGRNV
ncbi:hypothetical protein C0J52_08193 [Blattella germanica]|nr:hypothetical protein C0J52_08193 [Blattella germanica]